MQTLLQPNIKCARYILHIISRLSINDTKVEQPIFFINHILNSI